MPSDAVYADVDSLRAQADVERVHHDDVLLSCLSAASRVIDQMCNRPDGFLALTAPIERAYHGSGRAHLHIDECVEVSQVVASGQTLSDWVPYQGSTQHPSFSPPYSGIMLGQGKFLSSRLPTVRVAARWGYADVVPEPVRQATITLAVRWWMRGRSAWADTVIPEGGAGVLLYRQAVDPDVVLMLAKSRLVRVAV